MKYDSSMDQVYKNIRRFRLNLNMSREDLAEKLGYSSATTVHNVEKGKTDLSIANAKKYAEALGVSFSALLGLDDPEVNCDSDEMKNLAEKLRNNGFETIVFSSSDDAVDYIARKCAGKSVGFGDSTTCVNMGLVDRIVESSPKDTVFTSDRTSRSSGKRAITSNVFILGVSALSYETGEIINVCNKGIRASLHYPDEVIFVVGKNKISPNLADAMHKARNVTRPKAATDYDAKTPCVMEGKCVDCNSVDRVCRVTIIYHKKPKMAGDMTVILIDEELGR